MPAVQTAFGPIVEPGWPDLKDQGMGAKFLSGAYIMGNLNAKREELKGKMAQYALKMQAMEQDHELDNKRYQLAVDRLTTGNEFKDQALTIQQQKADAQDARVQLAYDTFDRRTAGDKAVFDAASNVLATIPKDSKEFPNAFVQAVTNNSRDADPAKARMLIQTNVNDYNINANRRNTAIDHQTKILKEEIGSKLYGDTTLGNLTDPLEHPESYPEETTGGGWGLGPYGVPRYKSGEEKSGYRTGSITLPTGEQKPLRFKTKDLTDLTKRWKEAQKVERLPTTDIPQYGVYANPAGSMAEKVQRILDDPDSPPDKRAAAQAWKEAHSDASP